MITLTPDEQLRLEALRLAVQSGRGGDIVKDAQAFYAFLTGKSDRTPREVSPDLLCTLEIATQGLQSLLGDRHEG